MISLLTMTPENMVHTRIGGLADGSNLPRADAIVAVLLLVPGILLTRLDIPSTNTVLGQLRSFQRRLA
jgi:hypothetical protein